jgi:outer membrane protein
MKKRLISILIAGAALAAAAGPSAIAADLTDVGYLDQAQLGSLPIFVSTNQQLAQYRAQLQPQFVAAMRKARTAADQQRVQMQFQQEFADKQRELVGPLFDRTQLAIASVAANRHLSIVVDKRIVVYGGQDITSDVINLFKGTQAIVPPSATPPPSEIGFVDESAIDGSSKVQSASQQMAQFETDERKIFGQKLQAAKSDADKRAIAADFQKTLQDKQNQLLTPLVNQTKQITANVAQKKGLMLVVDRADVIFGGTDITQDVQNALNK